MQKFLGILTRKERWGLSRRAWFVVIFIVFIAIYSAVLSIHPFLAVTRRVDTNFLVVEGWVHEGGIRTSVEEFNTGRYECVFTTGGPREGFGHAFDSDNAANVIGDWLHYRGIANEFLRIVPSRETGRDRTYNSALALRTWFREHNVPVHSMNVVTETAHARRTRLLYEKAFGAGVAVGIIAAPNPDYDPQHWWRYSDGVREVIGEGLAYIYARLFFYPAQAEREGKL